MGQYEFYLGPSDKSSFTLWNLNHITSIYTEVSKKTTPFGAPTLPARSVMVFDMEGPVRKFKLEGVRFDQEEPISNWDFIFARSVQMRGIHRLGPTTITNPFFTGIEWATSTIQTNAPYTFFIYYRPDTSLNGHTPEDLPNKADLIADINADDNAYIQGEFCVSVTNLSFKFDPKNIGLMTYSIELTERRPWK